MGCKPGALGAPGGYASSTSATRHGGQAGGPTLRRCVAAASRRAEDGVENRQDYVPDGVDDIDDPVRADVVLVTTD